MERLTKRWENGEAYVTDDYCFDNWANAFGGTAIDRLAYYEDMEEQGRLVEIVRCKDCKHWDKDKRVCLSGRNYIFYATKPDFFCADAENALKGGAVK